MQSGQTADRHKSQKMFRLDLDIHEALKEICEEEDRPISREIRSALIDRLKAKGKWPRPPKPKNGGSAAKGKQP